LAHFWRGRPMSPYRFEHRQQKTLSMNSIPFAVRTCLIYGSLLSPGT
jgi:hypothetical protein